MINDNRSKLRFYLLSRVSSFTIYHFFSASPSPPGALRHVLETVPFLSDPLGDDDDCSYVEQRQRAILFPFRSGISEVIVSTFGPEV